MGTVRTEQNGMEFTLVQSNNGVRMEFGGVEVVRFWPATGVYSHNFPNDPVPTPPPPRPPAGTVHRITTQAEADAVRATLKPGDIIEVVSTGTNIAMQFTDTVRLQILD